MIRAVMLVKSPRTLVAEKMVKLTGVRDAFDTAGRFDCIVLAELPRLADIKSLERRSRASNEPRAWFSQNNPWQLAQPIPDSTGRIIMGDAPSSLEQCFLTRSGGSDARQTITARRLVPKMPVRRHRKGA